MKKKSFKTMKPQYEQFFKENGKQFSKDIIPRDEDLKSQELKKNWSETVITLDTDGLQRVYERGNNDFFIDMGIFDVKIIVEPDAYYIFKKQLPQLEEFLKNNS
jgi:hypothetical protein